MNYQLVHFILTIVGSGDMAGNKAKYRLCFNHAVKYAQRGHTVEHEIVEGDDYVFCAVCSGDIDD